MGLSDIKNKILGHEETTGHPTADKVLESSGDPEADAQETGVYGNQQPIGETNHVDGDTNVAKNVNAQFDKGYKVHTGAGSSAPHDEIPDKKTDAPKDGAERTGSKAGAAAAGAAGAGAAGAGAAAKSHESKVPGEPLAKSGSHVGSDVSGAAHPSKTGSNIPPTGAVGSNVSGAVPPKTGSNIPPTGATGSNIPPTGAVGSNIPPTGATGSNIPPVAGAPTTATGTLPAGASAVVPPTEEITVRGGQTAGHPDINLGPPVV